MLKRFWIIFLCGLILGFSSISFAISPTILTKVDDLIKITFRGGKVAKSLHRVAGALPKSEITKLAEMAKTPGGLKSVGEILSKGKYADDVLENAYIRIAIENKVIKEEFGEQVFKNFSGTDGFRTILRKINIANPATAKGHLQELQIANEASKNGFKVVSFGLKYSDEIKKAETDMDILLLKENKLFAIESKAYTGNVPMDMVRADTESLLAFSSARKDCVPVFSFLNKPPRLAQKYLQSKNVNLLYGTPEEIALKLEHLAQCITK